MSANLANEISAAGLKVAPPAILSAVTASGWGVQEWMYAATLAYVVLQGAYLIWKWRREARKRG